MNDKEMLDWAEFVASKFQVNHDGWKYNGKVYDTGLKYIRYESDYTGYDHWTKRLARALDLKRMFGLDRLSKQLGFGSDGWKSRFIYGPIAHIKVSLRKDKNIPDAIVNGNIFQWDEDAQYVALFQPRVGMKVLEFVQADPDNVHAKAILAEMRACMEMNWPEEKEQP